jgi:hypothetical protein
LPWLAASLVALGAVVLASPAPAYALNVNFEPSQGVPGSTISIPESLCPYQPGLDQVWFSDRFVLQDPDGITEFFRPVATAILTPVGGTETEFGIFDAAASFIVPRLPAGRYYLMSRVGRRPPAACHSNRPSVSSQRPIPRQRK